MTAVNRDEAIRRMRAGLTTAIEEDDYVWRFRMEGTTMQDTVVVAEAYAAHCRRERRVLMELT